MREAVLKTIRERREPWDVIVIGGGATGAGLALDAATRGYSVVLFEQNDFGKGTSSRSTKLVHGGVRYLAQGNVSLVREALLERERMLRNAPHVVHAMGFLVPSYHWWEIPFYGIGLGLYDLLAQADGFGRSKWLGRGDAVELAPGIEPDRLRGGVLYYDGQFDDAHLLLDILCAAATQGASIVNYCGVTSLRIENGRVRGVSVQDAETGEVLEAAGRAVINATGAFCDGVRRMAGGNGTALVAASQGAHVVLDRSFLPGGTAVLVPRTDDGRVMFAIPWHGHTLVGTTDVAVPSAELEPRPLPEEVDFILGTARRYLARKPGRGDVLSAFAGIRPLVRSGAGGPTAALSRDHVIVIDDSGLVTVTGGKWTTYRRMAEDCLNRAAKLAGLPARECVTADLPIPPSQLGEQMARTVEDVLARRTRTLFLNARAAIAAAPEVAEELAGKLGRDGKWAEQQVRDFRELAQRYLV